MKEAGNFASYNYRCASAFALALRPCQKNSDIQMCRGRRRMRSTKAKCVDTPVAGHMRSEEYRMRSHSTGTRLIQPRLRHWCVWKGDKE
jgi:hypothetical protein